MRLRLLTVGRRTHDPLSRAAEDYAGRLTRYVKLEMVRLREASAIGERDAILARLDARDHVIVLDQRGRAISSDGLAKTIQGWQSSAVEHVVFIVGGAAGLPTDVRSRANDSWSLSALTLPHRLALVLLLEQLYRAHTILRGEPYHRG